jgi:hypothetical protein
MRLPSSNHYSAVIATLALAVAFGGTGYAAASFPHVSAKGAGHPTAPVAVIAVAANGHLKAQTHQAPAKAAPKVKRVVKGGYDINIPGVSYSSFVDAATCSAQAAAPVIAEVDGAGKSTLVVSLFMPDGSPVNSEFKCAIWNLKTP